MIINVIYINEITIFLILINSIIFNLLFYFIRPLEQEMKPPHDKLQYIILFQNTQTIEMYVLALE